MADHTPGPNPTPYCYRLDQHELCDSPSCTCSCHWHRDRERLPTTPPLQPHAAELTLAAT